tara:strand:+ start:176 stop:571 length:396 start_codon:yes stop_codon:yes gene_type:complete
MTRNGRNGLLATFEIWLNATELVLKIEALVVHTPRPGINWLSLADVAAPRAPQDTPDPLMQLREMANGNDPTKEILARFVADDVDTPKASQYSPPDIDVANGMSRNRCPVKRVLLFEERTMEPLDTAYEVV